MAATVGRNLKSFPPQPAWDVALGFPMQGEWTEADCLELEARFGNRQAASKLLKGFKVAVAAVFAAGEGK